MKNKILLMLVAIVITVFSSIVFASQDAIEVKLNGKYIDFTDNEGNKVEPELMNDRTMVPMRKIFETLGADVEWDANTERITAKTSEKEISLQINNNAASVKNISTGETKNITLDAVPVILNDRTMVPVRFIAESLDKQVGWDAKDQVVVIIDFDEILNKLKENCSKFIELSEAQTVKVESIDISSNTKGTISIKDKNDSSNNQQMSVTGAINYKQSNDGMIELDCTLKVSAKGELQKRIKEQGADTIKIKMILDINGEAIYVSSSLNNNQWLKSEIPGIKDIMTLSNSNDNNTVDFQQIMSVLQENMTKDTYEQLLEGIKLVELLFGNDKITVSGSSTKTYTIKWDLNEILSELQMKDDFFSSQSLSPRTNAKATIAITFKTGMNTKNKVDIDVDIVSMDESAEFELKINSDTKVNSYNKDIKITPPTKYETVDSLDFMNTPNDAKFAAFCQEYDMLQTSIQLKYYELYQKYAINLQSVEEIPTHFDIYKEVATGIASKGNNESEWVLITNFADESREGLSKPSSNTKKWYLRTSDGKLAYEGFEKEDGNIYYTPNVTGTEANFNPDLYDQYEKELERKRREEAKKLKVGDVASYNKKSDYGFAAFCQDYDSLQTQILICYYTLYQEYAMSDGNMPTIYDIYKEVATGKPSTGNNESEWVKISVLEYDGWYLRTSDGKLAYKGFQRENGDYYYTYSEHGKNTVTKFNDDIIK